MSNMAGAEYKNKQKTISVYSSWMVKENGGGAIMDDWQGDLGYTWSLATQPVVCRSAPEHHQGCLLEMQNLGPYTRPTDSESAF